MITMEAECEKRGQGTNAMSMEIDFVPNVRDIRLDEIRLLGRTHQCNLSGLATVLQK